MYKPYSSVLVCVAAKDMVSFCAFLGLKTGIDFAHFGLESSMVFEGVTGGHDGNYHLNSKSVRKKEKYANSKWI